MTTYLPPPGGPLRTDDADWDYCSNRCGRYVSGRTVHFWIGAWMGRGAALHSWLCDACYRAALAWEHQQDYRYKLGTRLAAELARRDALFR